MEDFIYAFIQLIHNLGAAGVVGSPAVAWWLVNLSRTSAQSSGSAVATDSIRRRLAWFTLFAWTAQIASGSAFGATTYYLKHELPELTGVGFVALVIKVSCAIICFVLTLLYLRTGKSWSEGLQLRMWQGLFFLGLSALICAAFLRWYG